MKTLIINTAFNESQIAIINDNKVDYIIGDSLAKHSESTLPNIDILLKRNKLSINDINCFAAVVGPGSFTGLRIAISLIKGFICGKLDEFKLITVSSFDLLKNGNKNIDAKAKFLINASNTESYVYDEHKAPYFVDNAYLINDKAYAFEFEKKFFENFNNIQFVDNNIETLINVVKEKITNNQFVKTVELVPVYIKKSQAEIELDKKENKNDN